MTRSELVRKPTVKPEVKAGTPPGRVPGISSARANPKQLSESTYKYITLQIRKARTAKDPKTMRNAVVALKAGMAKLSPEQSGQLRARYRKDHHAEFQEVLTALYLAYFEAGKASKQSSSQVASVGKPVLGPTIPQQPLKLTPGWLTGTQEFAKWMETIFISGQGEAIKALAEVERAVASASLTKIGKFYDHAGLGFTVAAEVLDIAQLSYEGIEKGSSPQKMRQAIVCLTVKTELVTIAGVVGGGLGGMTGPAGIVAAPAGAILFTFIANEAADRLIKNIHWCQL